MLLLMVLRMFRQFFKGSAAVGRLTGLLDAEKHPHVYHCYGGVAVTVYLAHIYVNVRQGFEFEHSVTAATAVVELIAHLVGA